MRSNMGTEVVGEFVVMLSSWQVVINTYFLFEATGSHFAEVPLVPFLNLHISDWTVKKSDYNKIRARDNDY
jgi:hypothetical protein